MPSRKMLRALAESVSHELATLPKRSPSPFDENIHVPRFFRRRDSAEIRAIQASVFENLEPFLPFRPSARGGLDSPPLSPKSRKEPAWVWPGPGCVVCGERWVRGGSANYPILIDEETEDGEFEDEGRRGSRVRSQCPVNDGQDLGSPRSEYAYHTDTETSKWSGSVVDENDLRSGACHEISSYRFSSLGDDEVTTPERGQDTVEPYISGGGDDFERPNAFRNPAEDSNRWAFQQCPQCPFEELSQYVGDEELQPGAEQYRLRSEVIKEKRGFEDRVEIEDEKIKTWRKFGDVYFLKEDDGSFESSDDDSELSERKKPGIETRETMDINPAHLAYKPTTTPAPARVKTPEPGRTGRRVTFAVDTTVEEEEACKYAPMRCVRCPRRPAEWYFTLGLT